LLSTLDSTVARLPQVQPRTCPNFYQFSQPSPHFPPVTLSLQSIHSNTDKQSNHLHPADAGQSNESPTVPNRFGIKECVPITQEKNYNNIYTAHQNPTISAPQSLTDPGQSNPCKLHSPTDAGQSNACQLHKKKLQQHLHCPPESNNLCLVRKFSAPTVPNRSRTKQSVQTTLSTIPCTTTPPPKLGKILHNNNIKHTHTHTPSTQNSGRVSSMCLSSRTLPGLPHKGVLLGKYHSYPGADAIHHSDIHQLIQAVMHFG
jgi:hypothetical protein